LNFKVISTERRFYNSVWQQGNEFIIIEIDFSEMNGQNYILEVSAGNAKQYFRVGVVK